MRELVRWCKVCVCVVVLAACGYPPLSQIASDPGGLDGVIDAPHGEPSPDVPIDAPDSSPDSAPDSAIDDPAAEFRSCVQLDTACGGDGNDDCCHTIAVPGGTHWRSYDLVGDDRSGNMDYPATVSGFRLDKYEVTVGRFRQLVNAGRAIQARAPEPGAGAHDKIRNSGWSVTWNAHLAPNTATLVGMLKCDSTFQTWTDSPSTNEQRPMNCLTWYEAMAFCIWDGGFLPTEAEWSYAAAGGDQQRVYPWATGSDPTIMGDSYASYAAVDGSECVGDRMPGCALTDLIPVGSMPAGDGLWGHSDLGGNVFEWTLDWFAKPYPLPCTDCANLITSPVRSYRGGGFNDIARDMRPSARDSAPPDARDVDFGVRCARKLPPAPS